MHTTFPASGGMLRGLALDCAGSSLCPDTGFRAVTLHPNGRGSAAGGAAGV